MQPEETPTASPSTSTTTRRKPTKSESCLDLF